MIICLKSVNVYVLFLRSYSSEEKDTQKIKEINSKLM